MFVITRNIVRQFRAVMRRAKLGRAGQPDAFVRVLSNCDSLRLQVVSHDVAIEHRQNGAFEAAEFWLPVATLEAVAGRSDDPVRLEPTGESGVLVRWTDKGVPRQIEAAIDCKSTFSFPELPQTTVANGPVLWSALRDAVTTADPSSTRYALGCVQLRGELGRVDATDGRQVLTHSGFSFGWEDEVLIPALPVLGCRELDLGEVAVGRTEDHVVFRVGQWSVSVRIRKEGRFPKIDSILPNQFAARSHVQLSQNDAASLADVLPRLPTNDALNDPVTLDLNGHVVIRSRETPESRTTELTLPSSQLIGEPVALCTNRKFLERALKLGFREAHIYGAESPVLCCDERRNYVWALLSKESVVPADDNALRIEPPQPARARRNVHLQSRKEIVMAASVNHGTEQSTAEKSAKPAKQRLATNSGTPVEQAIALRDGLATAARQANELIRSLKRNKRQTRIVESTLASLKALQKVAG
jgi:hypothetical protein